MNREFETRLLALGVSLADVEESFVRGAGPGGQKINKTSSTVCLRHKPSGVVVRCQAERSQFDNRIRAWNELCEKLESRRREQSEAARQEMEKRRRQVRQKSRGQKAQMIREKKHRAKHKAGRRPVGDE